jgi:hypothetical protein
MPITHNVYFKNPNERRKANLHGSSCARIMRRLFPVAVTVLVTLLVQSYGIKLIFNSNRSDHSVQQQQQQQQHQRACPQLAAACNDSSSGHSSATAAAEDAYPDTQTARWHLPGEWKHKVHAMGGCGCALHRISCGCRSMPQMQVQPHGLAITYTPEVHPCGDSMQPHIHPPTHPSSIAADSGSHPFVPGEHGVGQSRQSVAAGAARSIHIRLLPTASSGGGCRAAWRGLCLPEYLKGAFPLLWKSRWGAFFIYRVCVVGCAWICRAA